MPIDHADWRTINKRLDIFHRLVEENLVRILSHITNMRRDSGVVEMP
jgi:hypothetical protein